MDWHLWLLLKIFLPTFLLVDSKQEADLAQIKELPSGALLAEYDWHIPNAALLFQTSRSPLGHAIEDGLNYFGLWFSVIPGPYDKELQWPFPYPVNLTLVTRNGALPSVSAVLGRCRPTTRDKQGCGRAFLVPHEHVLEGSYFMGGSLLIRASVLLDNKDLVPKKARVFMRNQQLVSEFLWQVDALPSHESPVSSPPFRLDKDGYLLQLQLTLKLLREKGSVDPEVGATCPKAAFNKPHPNRPNPPCGFRRMGPLDCWKPGLSMEVEL
ncbi:uncharacterized protein CEXT_428981 [Caerostris extrusa]|uniref:TRAF1-6 MATH domain-containing protein n=1 Tax=Caerostris extrusa TaxID=172846 RepID=A0AAV4U4K0_CAEEX|nr:uncharacterized protein CEXT_428981 [Caerostris extrusa]